MEENKNIEEKDIEQLETDAEETTPETTSVSKSNTGISYSGRVTISIVNGNKVISKKQYHNAGTVYLFKFLCECLADQADGLDRPCKIRLFSTDEGDAPDNPHWNADTVASAAILYDNTPVPARDPSGGDSNKYMVSYHFRIPYAYITRSDIAKIALYSSRNADRYSEMSAYFCIVDSRTGDYAPIEMPVSAFNNYSIIIEWDMSITNQKN